MRLARMLRACAMVTAGHSLADPAPAYLVKDIDTAPIDSSGPTRSWMGAGARLGSQPGHPPPASSCGRRTGRLQERGW